MTRHVAIVTSGRQDWGYLRPLAKALRDDASFRLSTVALGTHLSAEHGLTLREVEADGFAIAERVENVLADDSDVGTARSAALALAGCAEAFDCLRPQLVVLLGDRYETIAAAMAATLLRLPIAHLYGGEATEGAIDEAFRHAISKMALLHFTAAPPYRDRIVQMGEAPERVHCVGSLALDAIATLETESIGAIEAALGLKLDAPLLVVTFHPATLNPGAAETQLDELLAALDEIPGATLVFTRPNADAEGRAIVAMLETYVAARNGRAVLVAALGQRRYFGLVRRADAVVGNSSSGIIEAPFLGTPSIDIGDRQRGRIAPSSVIRVPAQRAAIRAAIVRAREPGFRAAIARQENPYGDGRAAPRIAAILKSAPLGAEQLKKRFHMVAS